MEISEIRERIADKLSSDETHDLWNEHLDETNPANYGYELDSVYVDMKDIFVDVPARTFTFKTLDPSRMGAAGDAVASPNSRRFVLA